MIEGAYVKSISVRKLAVVPSWFKEPMEEVYVKPRLELGGCDRYELFGAGNKRNQGRQLTAGRLPAEEPPDRDEVATVPFEEAG